MRLRKFVVGIVVMPIVVNVISSDISPPLQKYTSLLTRYLIFVAIIVASCFGPEIFNYMKDRRCHLLPVFKRDLDLKVTRLSEDPGVTRCPDSSVIGRDDPLLCDPEVLRMRRMLECYDKARPVGVSSEHISVTIPTKLPAQDVPAEFKSKPHFRSLSGSRVLYWQFETGSCDLDDLSVQITQCMRRAKDIDENCTLQFGSFALLKYKDGELQWWRLQKERIPTISHISRSPRHLLEILAGEDSKWTVRGFNLENATLKASTMHKSETLKVLHHYKTESGEDVFLCKDPDLLGDSAPMFLRELYIYASSPVKVDGMTVQIQSQPTNVKEAYWISVLQSLKHPWSMLMITSSAILWVQLGFGIQYTYIGTFGEVVDELSWTIVAITIFNAMLWWHRHQPVRLSGYDIATAYDVVRLRTWENRRLLQDDLLEETTSSQTQLVHDNSMETFVGSQEEVFPGEDVFYAALTPTVAEADVNVTGDITVPPPMIESDSIENENMVEPDHDVLTPEETTAREDCVGFGSIEEEAEWSLDRQPTIYTGSTVESPNAFARLEAEDLTSKDALTEAVAFGQLAMDVENTIKIGQFQTVMDIESTIKISQFHSVIGRLGRLVRLLAEDVSEDIQRSAAFKLQQLAMDMDVETRIKIGQFPNVIERLVALLAEDVSEDVQGSAALTLGQLAMDVENRIKIGQCPDVIERLVAILAEDVSHGVQRSATFTLGLLAMDVANRIKIGRFPNTIERLVALLAKDVSKHVQQSIAFTLGHLAMDVENRIKISQFPNVIERLVALVAQDVSKDVQHWATFALRQLGRDAGNRIKIGQCPNVTERLVALLAEDVSHVVQRSAVFTLGLLAMDVENRIKIGQFPNAIERLVALLAKDASKPIQQSVAFTLGHLAMDAENSIKIGQCPDVIGRLVALLAEDVTQGIQRSASFTLGLLAMDVENRIKIGQFPNAIERLVALLAKDVSKHVQQSIAFTLGHLAMDAENRIKISQFSNVIERLVALLDQDVSKDVQHWATFALRQLGRDFENRMKIGQFPNSQKLFGLLT